MGVALAVAAALLVTVAPGVGGASGSRFSEAFPAQQRATVDPNVPATNYWAVLIGINDYEGSTRDNIGSYQDARDLRKYLLNTGWKSDHIALVANRTATASMIIQSIRWLASKTNSSSIVVFSYAGHEKPVRTSADGDDESMDVTLQGADNKLVLDGTLGRELNRVAARGMWINLAVCRAGGFRDPGMIKTGRVLTFSSVDSELSYEDPAVHYTVAGWYLIIEALVQGRADYNKDGRVTIEEAARYARPLVIDRTKSRQHPFAVDKLTGSLYLTPPPPAPPPPPPPKSNCTIVICR
jgi:caspase domain-containing protein